MYLLKTAVWPCSCSIGFLTNKDRGGMKSNHRLKLAARGRPVAE